jgi:hypothetical protein
VLYIILSVVVTVFLEHGHASMAKKLPCLAVLCGNVSRYPETPEKSMPMELLVAKSGLMTKGNNLHDIGKLL